MLRQELEERSKTVFDKRRLLELEEQKRRAEEDKVPCVWILRVPGCPLMRRRMNETGFG